MKTSVTIKSYNYVPLEKNNYHIIIHIAIIHPCNKHQQNHVL